MDFNDTICAIATPKGSGAIAVIRLSGSKTFDIIETVFAPKNKSIQLKKATTHTVHYGDFISDENEFIDDVLISVFKNPKSFTGEDSLEISCHASPYIQQEILTQLQKQGARIANPGEFTMRAYFNGKMDLVQAESVADIIASQSKNAHTIAANQMKGSFSNELKQLRDKLINFTALIELELDFSEEDVEFANRNEFTKLLIEIQEKITPLIKSFRLGNAIKNGVPVAIIGRPNAGKSTLLNLLLNEERAIVSSVEGTTRDTIEETLNIDGTMFRFIDTAGIRKTEDEIESLGIKKSYEKAKNAEIIIYLYDAIKTNENQVFSDLQQIQNSQSHLIICQNKIDLSSETQLSRDELEDKFKSVSILSISAKNNVNISDLIGMLSKKTLESADIEKDIILTNSRHLEILTEISQTVDVIFQNIESGMSGELISFDLKSILKLIGKITGEIDTDKDILGTIFGKFCIGK
ncbi:MAG: tRNA uridine-5-carboxymethylaminomethyl(34) synthesis GTPase MnmE [Flavobacteriales bacterium]|nr:tRNA uridine-5-carboxymethylaminomethyl(34) synthesis GTPase MnmE [Flavobacteriales bacterium]